MRVHELISGHPGWRQIAADKAKNVRAEARNRNRMAASSAERERVLAAHARKVEAAILDGTDPPSPPQLAPHDTHLDGATKLLLDRQLELEAQERNFLADHADTLEPELTERHDALIAQARPAVQQLEAIASEIETLVGSVGMIRQANGNRTPTAAGRITASTVADAVTVGRSFLRAGPAAHTTVYTASYAASADPDDIAMFTPEEEARMAPAYSPNSRR